MKYKLIDTHLHLDLFDVPSMSIDKYRQKNHGFIAMTNLPFVFKATEKLCVDYNSAYPSLGFHPELVKDYSNQISLFIDLVDHTSFIGEIGLDYSRSSDIEKKKQRDVLEKILSFCNKKEKVISIHARKAESDLLKILEGVSHNLIILHWFSGTSRSLETALKRGYYFSVNISMMKTKKGKEIVRTIPIDRILFETDMPIVNKNGLCPINSLETLPVYLSKIKHISIDEIMEQINRNQREIIYYNKKLYYGEPPSPSMAPVVGRGDFKKLVTGRVR